MKKLVVLVLALAALSILLAPAALAAAPTAGVEYVYTNDDVPGANTVTGLTFNGSTWTKIGSWATGGSGNGGGYYGHNLIEDTMIGTTRYIVASNEGSASITVFKVGTGGALTMLMQNTVESGSLAISLETKSKYLAACYSDTGNLAEYSINGTTGALTQIGSDAPVGGCDGIDVVASGGKYYAGTTGSGNLYVTTLSGTGPGTPMVVGTSGMGFPAGVTSDDAKFWYLGDANGSGTIIEACTPIATPTCTGYSISGGGVNSNTVATAPTASGRCLYAGNQYTTTVTQIALSGGVPTGSGTMYSTGQGGSVTGMEEAPGSGNAIGLLAASGPDNTVSAMKIGSGCSLSAGNVMATGAAGGWLMSIASFP